LKSERNQTLEIDQKDRKKYLPQIEKSYTDKNKVIQSEALIVLKQIPDDSIDLIFTDPPYNLSKVYSKNEFKKTDLMSYLKWSKEWMEEAKRVLKENGSIYICNDWRASALQLVLEKIFIIQNRITFEREKGRGSKSNWKNAHEDIWFCTKSKDYYFNVDAVKMKKKVIAPYKEDGKPKDWKDEDGDKFRLTHPSNFWSDITIPFWSMPENTDHPTQKSEKLVAKAILASSKKGDIVLDMFGGSGTTAVVAKKLNRNFTIIEPQEEYCLYTLKRLDRANDNKRIQGYEDGIFWERNSLQNIHLFTKNM
jgi:site-specific DNA-methyltransferase (adenine-specific)